MRILAAVALLGALLAPAPGAPASGGPPDGGVDCGNVSPVGNSCGAGDIIVTQNVDADAVVLGYFGRVTIFLRQTIPGVPVDSVTRWYCDALGAADPHLTQCYGPFQEGRVPVLGIVGVVTCHATGHPQLLVAPPLGPWGCLVTN